MNLRVSFKKFGLFFLTLLLCLWMTSTPSAQEPTEPKEAEFQGEKQEQEGTKKAKKKKSKKRGRRRGAKQEEEKKEKKPPEPQDVLGFVEKFYNVGMGLTISEEDGKEIKMLVLLGAGTPQLIVSKALVEMAGENFNMLGFAIAHQLGHVYSFNRRILYRDPDWKRQRWSRAAREEEYRADRFAMTLMSFSPDMNTDGAKQFLSACGVKLGDGGNFCHTLPEMFLDREFRLRNSLDERVEFSLTTGRWISDNFVQTHAEYWPRGVDHSEERKLVRDFQSIIPSMICWPHC